MSKAAHTPTPWQMCTPSMGEDGHQIAIFVNGNKCRIASVDFSVLRTAKNLLRAQGCDDIEIDVSYEAQEANAVFIETSVNHHQELVTRLYNLVNAARTGSALEFHVQEAEETLKKVIQ